MNDKDKDHVRSLTNEYLSILKNIEKLENELKIEDEKAEKQNDKRRI